MLGIRVGVASMVIQIYQANLELGGLLIVYSLNMYNNGYLQAIGSKGGENCRTPGGSSGGGSINVFSKSLENNNCDKYDVSGGKAPVHDTSSAIKVNGGAGGLGTATVGTITNGQFQKIDV